MFQISDVIHVKIDVSITVSNSVKNSCDKQTDFINQIIKGVDELEEC